MTASNLALRLIADWLRVYQPGAVLVWAPHCSSEEIRSQMRRRQFLATLPAAAAGAASLPGLDLNAQTPANPNGAMHEAELPKFQAPGEEKFVRPDVHAGDRPAGASF